MAGGIRIGRDLATPNVIPRSASRDEGSLRCSARFLAGLEIPRFARNDTFRSSF